MMRKGIILILSFVLLAGCMSKYSEITTRDMETNKIIGSFAKQMQKQRMHPIGFGGAEKEGKTTLMALAFQIDEVYDIEISRKVLVETTQAFLDCINSTANFREYMCAYPFSANEVEITLFPKIPEKRDENYVCVAGAYEGVFRYKTDHPDPENLRLVTLHEETFEEAVEIVKNQEKEKRATIIGQ